MTWLAENLVNIVIILMIAGLVALCIKSLIDQKKSGLPACACGKNCAHCALKCAHTALKKI